MGEITVFAVAALAVVAMIELGGPGRGRLGSLLRAAASRSPILQSFARLTLHLMLLFAILSAAARPQRAGRRVYRRRADRSGHYLSDDRL